MVHADIFELASATENAGQRACEPVSPGFMEMSRTQKLGNMWTWMLGSKYERFGV